MKKFSLLLLFMVGVLSSFASDLTHTLDTETLSHSGGVSYTSADYEIDGFNYQAVYAKSGGMQFNRSSSANNASTSGLVVTAVPNGWILKKITVTYADGNTTGREMNIYGSEDQFTATSIPDDLTTYTLIESGKDVSADKLTAFGIWENGSATKVESVVVVWTQAISDPEFSVEPGDVLR